MRTTVVISVLSLLAVVFTKTVFFETTQHNSMYQHAPDAQISGSGDDQLEGQNASGDTQHEFILYESIAYLPFELARDEYYVDKASIYRLIYHYGNGTTGMPLWTTADLVILDQLTFGQPVMLPILVGVPGTFTTPTSLNEFQPSGALNEMITNCRSGEFTLCVLDYKKVSNVDKQVGVEDRRWY